MCIVCIDCIIMYTISPGGGGGGGTRYIKKVGMLVENFEIDP